MKRIVLVLGLAALLALGAFGVASAHAELDHCTPATGSKVATAPSQVVCVYSEEIDTKASTMSVWDANNNQVDKKDAHVDLNDPDHKTLIVSLDTSLVKDGAYTVKWHAVTPDDGGISDGSWQFIVGTAAVTPQPTTEIVNPATATPPGNTTSAAPTTAAAQPTATTAATVAPAATATTVTAATTAATPSAPSTAVPPAVPTTGGTTGANSVLVLLALAAVILLVGGVALKARG